MTPSSTLKRILPRPFLRHILHFECAIEDAVQATSTDLQNNALVLDAGAGEGQYREFFQNQIYIGLDLGIGDATWNYANLDVISNLENIPIRNASLDAVINIVTLEHVKDPARVVCEISRCLRPGGRLLLVVPHEWEEHQQPHDYYRYTRYGVRHLLEQAHFTEIQIEPAGGYFRLLARRLLNGIQFFPTILKPIALILFAPPALILPFLDSIDEKKNFTLGFICTARK